MPLSTQPQGRTFAGIYIRVSSEPQAEKVSPEIQEKDARKYCELNGYTVVEVYRDVSRYKVGKKSVEPSGTRLDRPEFQRMLKDARSGRINCIIAWKEDRLYRAFRPMLEVLELLESSNGAVRVELVKENFDSTMAPLKAWLAKMELKTKNDRWHMGMRGRLGAGKVVGYHCYGYDYDKESGFYSINKEEANWVYHIWKWYGEGYTLNEIHKALIANGAQQKNYQKRKVTWSTGVIKNILQRDYYYTCQKPTTIGDETYNIEVEQIIDEATYRAVIKRREKWIASRPGHRTFEYHTAWLEGILFCAGDNWRMGINYTQNIQNFISSIHAYKCVHKYHMHTSAANCAGWVRMDWIDRYVWDKLWEFIHDPATFESRVEQRIEQLQTEQKQTNENLDVLTSRLEELKEERRRVATMFRRNLITEDEMSDQLTVVQDEELEITDQIAKAGNTYGEELDRVREVSRIFRSYMADGLEGLEVEPTDPELFRKWSATVKGIIQAFVQKVDVDKDYNVRITTHIDLTSKLPETNIYGYEVKMPTLVPYPVVNKEQTSRITC